MICSHTGKNQLEQSVDSDISTSSLKALLDLMTSETLNFQTSNTQIKGKRQYVPMLSAEARGFKEYQLRWKL